MLLITVEPVDKPERGKWLRQSRVADGRGFLGPDQRFRGQYRLHHETAGAGIHHADGA